MVFRKEKEKMSEVGFEKLQKQHGMGLEMNFKKKKKKNILQTVAETRVRVGASPQDNVAQFRLLFLTIHQ